MSVRARELEGDLEAVCHHLKAALERVERLEQYIREAECCFCFDDYGRKRPTPCDRCAILGVAPHHG